jgi:para-nitrobenzyl esterase
VTIFGESGGGTKTLSLLSSPLAKGLFHKAIVESGSGSASPERTTTLASAEAAGERIAKKLGATDQKGVLAGLRSRSWEDLISAAADPALEYRANLTVDGWVLPSSVHDTLKEGKQHDVPLIVGANAGEQRELQESVPLLASLMSKTASSKTYVYSFSHVPAGWKKLSCSAFHGLELPYVFGYVPQGLTVPTVLFLGNRSGCKSTEPGPDEKDQRVAEHAMSLWAKFAATGNPSVEGLVTWPAYTGEGGSYLDIGETLKVKQGVQQAYIAPPQAPTSDVGAPAPSENAR